MQHRQVSGLWIGQEGEDRESAHSLAQLRGRSNQESAVKFIPRAVQCDTGESVTAGPVSA